MLHVERFCIRTYTLPEHATRHAPPPPSQHAHAPHTLTKFTAIIIIVVSLQCTPQIVISYIQHSTTPTTHSHYTCYTRSQGPITSNTLFRGQAAHLPQGKNQQENLNMEKNLLEKPNTLAINMHHSRPVRTRT